MHCAKEQPLSSDGKPFSGIAVKPFAQPPCACSPATSSSVSVLELAQYGIGGAKHNAVGAPTPGPATSCTPCILRPRPDAPQAAACCRSNSKTRPSTPRLNMRVWPAGDSPNARAAMGPSVASEGGQCGVWCGV